MAGITHIATINMVGALAAGLHAIVAANTVARKAAVIHRGRQPGNRAVTTIAFFKRIDMLGVFTARNHTVMAG